MNRINFSALSIVLATFFACSSGEEDPYPEFKIPIYPNAIEVQTGYDNSIYGKSINYDLTKNFPADGVINFYQAFLSEKGFSILENSPQADSRWVKFNRKTLQWDISADSPPARYFSVWVDKNQNLMFKLTLDQETNDQLSISCFLHPFIREERMVSFDKWVEKNGRENELAELMQKYTKEDHNFDFDEALKENPKNEIVLKLHEVFIRDRQDIRDSYKRHKKSLQ